MITTNLSDFRNQYTPYNESVQMLPQASNTPVQPGRWPRLMRLGTLAEYLDMSPSTVSKMVKSGQLPPPSVAPTPRLQRWSRNIIDAFFEKKAEANYSGPTIDELMARPSRTNGGGL